MKKVCFIAIFAMMFFAACSSSSTPTTVGFGETDDNSTTDTNNPKPDINPKPDTNPPLQDDPAPADEDPGTPTGKTCSLDSECGKGNICAEGKCAAGCKSDADCSAFGGTTCNTTVGRCLNEKADSAACAEGCGTCCYAGIGLKKMKCAPSESAQYCGICPQGKIYEPNSKQCMIAACTTASDTCSTLNSTAAKASCFKCSTTNVCAEEANCTGYYMLDSTKCIPAGETCSKDSQCCSGQPCIQGYCY